VEIAVEIAKYYQLKPYPKYTNCWRSDVGDSSSEFITTIFKIFPDSDICVSLIAVNFFDEKLCDAIIKLIESEYQNIPYSDNILSFVIGLNVKGYPFDCLAVINYEAFQMFEAVDKELDRKVCGVIPIARCELIGTESADDLLGIFVRLIEDINWKREITPRISMKYQLYSGSGRKYKLYDNYALSCAMEELSDEKKYKIEIMNYKEQYIKIFLKDGLYSTISKEKEVYFQSKSLVETEQWLNSYLTLGLS